MLAQRRRYFIMGRLGLTLLFLGFVAIMLVNPALRPHGVFSFIDGLLVVPGVMTVLRCVRILRRRETARDSHELGWMLD